LTPNSLFLSLVVSTVGLGLFIYGKKQQRLPQLIALTGRKCPSAELGHRF